MSQSSGRTSARDVCNLKKIGTRDFCSSVRTAILIFHRNLKFLLKWFLVWQ